MAKAATTAVAKRAPRAPAKASTEIVPAETGALTPAAMLERAISKGAGVEVMGQLLDMHAKWEAMQARKAFDGAMASLRENMPTVVKNQTVDFTTSKGRTNYRYEDLSDVTEALSPVMSGLGLSFRWHTENVQAGVKVTCIITHRDGHSEETSLIAPLDNSGNKNAIQALGSAVTYLQRYTLKAAVGIAASKDDDGQSAAPRPDEPRQQRAPQQRAPEEGSQQLDQTTAQGIFERLSKANAALQSIDAHNKFWMRDDVRAAANNLPLELKKSLGSEKAKKMEALQQPPLKDEDIPFPGDLPMETAQ